MTTSPYGFTYCAASDDGTLYVTGVVEDLEDQDVKHTILWERIDGQWNKYKWGNRSYGLAAYPDSGGSAAVYLGYDGTLKVRSQVKGSTVQSLESGDDAPSQIRTVTCIRAIGAFLFVVGMRRMVYRRGLEEAQWHRFDNGMRVALSDPTIAGLRSIDGEAADRLVAVGLDGEIWGHADGAWQREDSPTNIRLSAVRHVGAGEYVIGGADGTLITGRPRNWQLITHDLGSETFRCIDSWSGRCFIGAESGQVYELTLGPKPALAPLALGTVGFVAWFASTRERIYFLGRKGLQSMSAAGWRDDSPPASLLV